MNFIAQTTQAASSGMSTWDAAQWTVFFTAAAGFLGALATAIVAIIKAGNAQASSAASNATANAADQKADHAITQANVNTGKLIDIARDMPSKSE
jgi:hypothetical protein